MRTLSFHFLRFLLRVVIILSGLYNHYTAHFVPGCSRAVPVWCGLLSAPPKACLPPEHDIGPPTAVTRLPHRIIVSDFGAPSVYFFLSLTITIVTGASVAVNCPLLRIFRGLKEANQLCLARSLALSYRLRSEPLLCHSSLTRRLPKSLARSETPNRHHRRTPR